MPDNEDLVAHIRQQIADFRRKLLDLTLRNPLLSFRHAERAATYVRIVDELPDVAFEKLESGNEMEFLALEPPRLQPDDEDTEEFTTALADFKHADPVYREEREALERRRASHKHFDELERKARDRVRFRLRMPEWEPEVGLQPAELARRRGLDPRYDLPSHGADDAFDRHHDDGLQTLHFIDQLEARLRGLRERARSSVRETGIPILCAAFGFLEWYEDDRSDRPHHAPLLLLPLEMSRRRQHQRYRYFVTSLDQPARSNVTLERYLDQRFGLILPSFELDDTPESYFAKVASLCNAKPRWQVRRFLTIGVFPFSKLAIYEDLDLDGQWADSGAFVGHPAITALVASAGDTESPFGEEYAIDELTPSLPVPQLIYDADSSQHSAIIDVLRGTNLAIHGPPGTGKSQTITNIIAAAMAAGQSVLFVAEKLAALDVVADRLHKAGLANFCLTLHGRSVRKSEVLTSFKERLEMERPSFDAAQYRHDTEEWTAQRDALKRYAHITNEPVGRLPLTIHDVLWEHIRNEEHLATMPQGLRHLELSEAVEFSPADVRTAREALVALEESYQAAMDVVTDRNAHPWRGVRRADLTPFDIDIACDLAGRWAQALAGLKSLVDDVFLPDASGQHRYGEVIRLMNGLQRLPAHIPALCLQYSANICHAEFRVRIVQFVQNLHTIERSERALRELTQVDRFEAIDRTALERLYEVSCRLGLSHLTSSHLEAEIRAEEHHVESLIASYTALERLRTLFGIAETSEEALQKALEGARCVASTTRDILLQRTDQLLEETNGLLLREGKTRLDALQRSRAELSERFYLSNLPGCAALRNHAAALRSTGLFKVFRSEVKSAKALHRQLHKSSDKRSLQQMADDFDALARYMEATDFLVHDQRLSEILGPAFRGVETDMASALQVNTWASEVVGMFPGIDPIRQTIRETILHSDIVLLDEIQNVWSALPDGMRQALEHGEKSLAGVREDAQTASDRLDQLRALSTGIVSVGLAPEKTLADLEQFRKLLDTRNVACAEVAECSAAETFFGEVFRGAETDITPHQEVIATLDALDKSDLSDAACAALLAWAERNNASIGGLQDALDHSLTTAKELWKRIVDRLEISPAAFLPPSGPESRTLAELLKRAEVCMEAREALVTWRTLQADLITARQTAGGQVVKAYETAAEPFTGLASTFEGILYQSLANWILRKYPELQRLSGSQLAHYRHAFVDLDEKLLELGRRRLANALHQRSVEAGVGIGRPGDYTERALIQHQVSLQRSTLPLRDLIHRAGSAARQLKPCFMMSPLTVAQFLPRTTALFDLVIIDEASQMRPEDAFGALVRAKQCVVVGDPQQLPPTSFFETSFWSSATEDDVDDLLFEQVDSILDLALRAFRPTRYLRWHYRSRHSGLIAFSNRHFYDDKLIVFPGANEDDPDAGVHLQSVQGTYAGSQNVAEAEAVVRAALSFMTSQRTRNLSLGVVAINQPQRDLLEELFDRAFAEYAQAERYRRKWESTLYPFFIKNLENVQGDERDAIFISMTYGPEAASGRVLRRFGPITWPGGHRRLNVLFTRARRLVRVFSSMTANDIQIGERTSEGTRILRDYLDYAATGRLETGRDTGRAPESPFEEVVKAALESHGYTVTPQVGVAGYRIDLGIRHPTYPHGYILGVECDGATYHAAKSVRDRDRLRQMILEGLGWDLYRIWSTDWFHNPERELGKLLEHLNQHIKQARSKVPGTTPDTQTPGVQVMARDQSLGDDMSLEQEGQLTEPQTQLQREADDAASAFVLEENRPVVGIGDVVTYQRLDSPNELKKVTIVSGPDDPRRGIINDAKPLAIALLGIAEGEETMVEQPTHSFEVRVTHIEKAPVDVSLSDNVQQGPFSIDAEGFDGVAPQSLRPYPAWQGTNTPDPRTTDVESVAHALFEIIEWEGPVLVARVYRLYAKACGLQRAGRQVRSALNRALSKLVHDKRIVLENEGGNQGQINGIVRVAGRDRVHLRKRGPRTLAEIPLPEIADHLRQVKELQPDLGKEESYRELLSRYELERMTTSVRAILDQASRLV